MLKIAKVTWKTNEDYANTEIKIDINQPDFTSLLYQAARHNPKRISITNIKEIPENYLQLLGLQHREFDISLNGKVIPTAGLKTAHYNFVDLNYDRIPTTLADMFINNETTCGETLTKYRGKKIPTEIFPLVMECFKLYTKKAAEMVTKLNKIEDWRIIEDFYVTATYIGNKSDPKFKVYSPSGKTYLEELFYSEYEEDINDITEPLIADLELIQFKMKEYGLNVPDIRVIRDSKQAWKTKYTKTEYGDMDIEHFVPFKPAIEEAPKFHGFTRPLDSVVYWPDKDTLLKKYYNDTKERNIPKDIRAELTPIPVQPNAWYNINYAYAEWLESQPEEIRLEFFPMDSDICPECHCRYNIYNGCQDPETEEYHVEPLLETKANKTKATIEYYDSFTDDDSCFCHRVEAYLEKLARNK